MRHEAVRPNALVIGELAARTGCSAPTIRFYEEIGLIPKALRTEGGRRSFSEADVERLVFIRRCRDFGFSVEQVRDLLALSASRERNCVEARDLASAHLESVRTKMAEMAALERDLAAFVHRCDVECAGGPAADCVILDDLAEPGCCRAGG